MLKDAIDVFINYIMNLPDPIWIRFLALLGIIWLIYVTKVFVFQLITIVFYFIAFVIWITNKITKFIVRKHD